MPVTFWPTRPSETLREKTLDDLARAEHDEGIYDRLPGDPDAGQ